MTLTLVYPCLLYAFLMVQDEESGRWYQHKGRDFKVLLIEYLQDDGNLVGPKKSLGIWPGWF